MNSLILVTHSLEKFTLNISNLIMPLIKSFLIPDLNSKLTELPRKNTAPSYRERRANERPEDGGTAPEGLRGKGGNWEIFEYLQER